MVTSNDVNSYGTLHRSLKVTDDMKLNKQREINVIYNLSYSHPSILPKTDSTPCVITNIDYVDTNTPSVITNIDQNKAYTKMHSNDSQVTLNDGEDYAIEDGIHYSFTCTAQGKTSGDRNDCDNNRHINKHVKDESLCRVTDDISGDIFDGATLRINDSNTAL